MNIAMVVGARPNFIKVAPVLRALNLQPDIVTTLIHTGQHYDARLSDIFLEELDIQTPDVCLGVGSGKHGAQTGRILQLMEKVLEKGGANGKPFHRLVVVGDVNSTMAAALAAVKLGIPVAHVEAGLRSFDRSMPEEINRIVTDGISDLHLVSEPVGLENLRREGHADDRLHLVGNVMIDTLRWLLPKARAGATLDRLGLTPQHYGVVTLHRPSNVDCPQTLSQLIEVLVELSRELPLVFPVHPRTQLKTTLLGLDQRMDDAPALLRLPPQGYLDLLALTSSAKVVITDSGGLQEETTALSVPCLTLRHNTERPITVDEGTSTLVGNDPDMLRCHLSELMEGRYKQGHCPALWDGHAANRIVAALKNGHLPSSNGTKRHRPIVPRVAPVAAAVT